MVLNYFTQLFHSSNKGRRNITDRYPIRSQRVPFLICKPQISITWVSRCVFLVLCPYGKIFRFPTVLLPLVLYCFFGGAIVFLTIKHLAILDVVRSEKKRKMENVSEFGFHDYTFDLISVNHIFQEECEEETKENSKGNTTLRTRYPDFLRSQRSQPSVLPEYQGVDLKDVQTESSLFEGLTFSELLA